MNKKELLVAIDHRMDRGERALSTKFVVDENWSYLFDDNECVETVLINHINSHCFRGTLDIDHIEDMSLFIESLHIDYRYMFYYVSYVYVNEYCDDSTEFDERVLNRIYDEWYYYDGNYHFQSLVELINEYTIERGE